MRLVIGVGVLAVVSLAPDGESVWLSSTFFNSSGRTLVVERADIDLPGARVLGAAPVDDRSDPSVPPATVPLPAHVDGGDIARLVERFVPEDCSWGSFGDWGAAVLHLEVDNGWLPSISRDWRIPGGLVTIGQGELSVWPLDDAGVAASMTDPLMAACAVLAAAPG